MTFQQQLQVSFLPNSSEHEDDDVGEKIRSLSEKLRPNNIEIDYTAGKIVKDQAEAMYNFKYTSVGGMFNKKFLVPKTSGQLPSYSPCQGVKVAYSTSSKRILNDKNNLMWVMK